MTAELVRRARAERDARVKKIIGKLAHEVPELAELDQATLEKVARLALIDELKGKVKRAADLEKIDHQADRKRFLDQAGRERPDGTRSRRTRDLYTRALERLEDWCSRQGMSPLELTSPLAEDWIGAEVATGRSPSTVNLDVSVAAAFFSRLEYWHQDKVRNPFRGTRARPKRRPVRKLEIPSDREVQSMEESAAPELRAVLLAMTRMGLRVGALPTLSINGMSWKAFTKGKEQKGTVPEEVRQAILAAGRSLRAPFADLTAQVIILRVRRLVTRLYRKGNLAHTYGCHDLRHAFAVRLYRQTKDIYRVKMALGHANVGVTEGYLRTLGLTS